MYLRWLQWGAHAPILRTHPQPDPAVERRPWGHPLPYSEFMIAALEGLLCEELRPAFVTCDEENLTRFGAIHRRIATLTQQLKLLQSGGGKDYSEVVKPQTMIAATSPTRTPPAIERAVSSRALSPSAASPTSVFGNRDAKVGIEAGVDYAGHDLFSGVPATTSGLCQRMCRAYPLCRFFTWSTLQVCDRDRAREVRWQFAGYGLMAIVPVVPP